MTRLKRLTMPLLVFASLAFGAIAMSACLALSEARAAVAHLAVAADLAPAAAPIDWGFWLGLVASALGAASLLLHWIAPRTKNTWDDKLRDDVDLLRKMVSGLIPATGVPATFTAEKPTPGSPPNEMFIKTGGAQ